MVLTPEEIAWRVTRRDGRVFLVAHATRVGACGLAAAIEWYWYAPGTSRNRFYDAWGTMWRGIGWNVVAFPVGRLPAVRNLARRLGLRISDGKPAVDDSDPSFKFGISARPSYIHEIPGTFDFFPGARLSDGSDNTAMHTIEQHPGSPVYKNSMRDTADMLHADVEINATFQRGVRLTPAQIVDYIYGPGFPARA